MHTFPSMLSIPSTKQEMHFSILTTLMNLQIMNDDIVMLQTHRDTWILMVFTGL
jgi:hypothetical protein